MWLIYALGGGWGHLTRTAALARAARPGHHIRILTNSPHAGWVRRAASELDIVECATRMDAVREVLAARPSCLIVDTFPRGLGGELAGVLERVDAVKVLIHRDLSPAYVQQFQLCEFVARHYDLVLIPGEGEGSAFGHLPAAATTAPWLLRSEHELSRERSTGVIVCAAGRPEERDWYQQVATALGVTLTNGIWPAMELFARAQVVVGGGGYNIVHECLALGVPLVARSWPRLYDRQWLRLARAAELGMVVAVDTVEQAVAAARLYRQNPSQPVRFDNGVHAAVRLIEGATASPLTLECARRETESR